MCLADGEPPRCDGSGEFGARTHRGPCSNWRAERHPLTCRGSAFSSTCELGSGFAYARGAVAAEYLPLADDETVPFSASSAASAGNPAFWSELSRTIHNRGKEWTMVAMVEWFGAGRKPAIT